MSLKIVHKICCGIDVHKTFVVACIASTNNQGVTTYRSHRFSTYTKVLKSCYNGFLLTTAKMFVWNPPANTGFRSTTSLKMAAPSSLLILNTLKLSEVRKPIKKNAKWIADIFKHDLVAGSFMPPADIRQLRDLMRYRFKLINFISSEKNRLQNCLTVSNIQLANVVSDAFGKSAQNILDKILENPQDTSFDILPLIHGSMKAKLPELELAVDGFINPQQAGKLAVIKAHIKNLETRKADLESLILALASPYQQQLDLIQSLPSVKSIFTAIDIISEIGVDMSTFPSAKHLCSWAGLTPTNNESAGKKKSVRVSKAGCYIKPLLVQCANAVVKSQKHPEIRNRYLRLKKRRGHKKAIIAIARMLLTALYHMLRNGEYYNAQLYRNSDLMPAEREISQEQVIAIAKSLGYRIKPDIA